MKINAKVSVRYCGNNCSSLKEGWYTGWPLGASSSTVTVTTQGQKSPSLFFKQSALAGLQLTAREKTSFHLQAHERAHGQVCKILLPCKIFTNICLFSSNYYHNSTMMPAAYGKLSVQNYAFCDSCNVWMSKWSPSCSRCPAVLVV